MKESELDLLLRQPVPTDASALKRARARCREELAHRKPPLGWKKEIALLFLASAGLAAAVGAAGVALGAFDAGLIASRLLGLGLLAAVGAAGAWAALRPGARISRPLAVALGVVGAAAIALARWGVPNTGAFPEWVCSGGHFAMGLLPLAVATWILRRTAYSPWRAAAAGVGSGTLGAMVGELACSRGFEHVILHHAGAWSAVAVATILIASRIRRRAYAP